MKPIIVAIFSLLSTTIFVFSADFYVSTAGSDSNPGTPAQPFATIQHAIDACPAEPTTSIIHLDASTWNESPSVYQKEISIIGDYSGPNGMGGQGVTLINGCISINLAFMGPPMSYYGSTTSHLDCKGINIAGCDFGYPAGGSAHAITYCNINSSSGTGITLSQSTDLNVNHCSIFSNPGAAIVATTRHAYIDHNNVYNNGNGLDITSTRDCNINNNEIYNNAGDGIYWRLAGMIIASTISTINNNIIHNNLGAGLRGLIAMQHFLNINDNNIYENGSYGIYYSQACGKTYNNLIQNNSSCGCYIYGDGALPDLGGGEESSPGNNTISGNWTYEVYNNCPNNPSAKYNHWDSQSEGQMAGGYYNTVNVTRIWDKWEDSSKGYIMWSDPNPTKTAVPSIGLIKATFYPSSNTIQKVKVR